LKVRVSDRLLAKRGQKVDEFHLQVEWDSGVRHLEHSDARVGVLVRVNARTDEDVVEVEMIVSTWLVENFFIRVIPQVCKVVVSHHFDGNGIMILHGDLKVAIRKCRMPHLSTSEARARVNMASDNELAARARSSCKLRLKPVKLLISLILLELCLILQVHVFVIQRKDRELVSDVSTIEASLQHSPFCLSIGDAGVALVVREPQIVEVAVI